MAATAKCYQSTQKWVCLWIIELRFCVVVVFVIYLQQYYIPSTNRSCNITVSHKMRHHYFYFCTYKDFTVVSNSGMKGRGGRGCSYLRNAWSLIVPHCRVKWGNWKYLLSIRACCEQDNFFKKREVMAYILVAASRHKW